jgi:hypothetical protein
MAVVIIIQKAEIACINSVNELIQPKQRIRLSASSFIS